MTKQKISCIIACYKDDLAIPYMYERIVKTFEEIEAEYEIIFVNDASPDNSVNTIKTITEKDDKVIGINHRRNFGSQAAFLSGMKISTGDAVVLMDGDLQDPPEIIAFANQYIDHNKMFTSDLSNKFDDFYSAMGWGQLPENNNAKKFFNFGN